MADLTMTAAATTIGVDLGDKWSHWCRLDGTAEVLETGRVRTTPPAIRERFGAFPRARVAIEVGTHSPWLSRLLQELGHEVVVANPRMVRLISQSDSKDDTLDAEMLARLARTDPKLLHPIRHRGPQAQKHLAVLRSRATLVRLRTALVNHVRGAVKAVGGKVPRSSTRSFAGKAAAEIPADLRVALDPILEVIGSVSCHIRGYDQAIETVAQETYPETALLRQVSGVGPLTSVAFVLTIEDPGRFPRSRTVGAYLGLRPRRQDSGEKRSQLRITKAGDVFVRRLLVGSAQYILGPFGPDTALRRWGLALHQRGGKNAKKRAAVAVARKLAVLLHRLWVTGEVYEPLRNAQAGRPPGGTAA